MRQLQLTTFGGMRFHYADDTEVRLSTRKTAGLLAYICLHAGRRIAREFLCGLLWGDKTEALARHSLNQALSEIRKKFGEALVRSDADVVWIDANAVWVDAFELKRLTVDKTTASLDRAESLYQGEFLAFSELNQDRFDEWLFSEREKFRQVAQRSLAMSLALRAGDTDAERRLSIARTILALDPFDEEAHCAVMQAHAAQGNISFAIDHFERLKRSLRQELGIAPAPKTVETFQTIVEQSQPKANHPRTLAQYASVLEQLPHPVVVTDTQSRIVGWNALAEQTSGFCKTEICGRKPSAVLAPHANPAQADSILKHAVQWGRWSKSVDMVGKNGQRSRQQRIVTPLYTPEGEFIGAFAHGIILEAEFGVALK
jgi:PAS domain S-box-containing protein